MKTILFIRHSLFMIFLVGLSTLSFAQLSGTVTVNSAQSTSGTNYQSFSSLAAILNSVGINGPLVVNVVSGSGPYIEQPVFNQINGVSPSQTITVNGNQNQLAFTSTASGTPWTLALNGTDYMFIHQLNIVGGGTVYALPCVIYNGADNNQFNACTFSCSIIGNSSTQIPMALVPNPVNFFASGASGSYNTFNSCSFVNGMYGAYLNTSNTTTTSIGNVFYKCSFTDFINQGLYCTSSVNLKVQYCDVSRPNRTTSLPSIYGLRFDQVNGLLCEGNCVKDLYAAMPGSTVVCYGIFSGNNLGSGQASQHVFRNNQVSSLNSNGAIFGMYVLNTGCEIYHNTVLLNDASSTSSLSTYGIYTGQPNNNDSIKVRNNLVSITRSGTGTKYCVYYHNMVKAYMNNNLWHMGSTGGSTNFTGYYLGSHATLSQLQSQGIDLNSFSVSPNFTATGACSLVPSNPAFDNAGAQLGVILDAQFHFRNQLGPDIGAMEFNTPACTGTLGSISLVTSQSVICPNAAATLSVSNPYSQSGITYLWSSSTSSTGPFTSIPGASTYSLQQSIIPSTTWFQVVATCTNPGGGTYTTMLQQQIASVNISVLPNNHLCIGETVTLQASGLSTYTWSNGNTSPTQTMSPLSSSNFTVQGTNTGLGCNLSGTVGVTVNQCAGGIDQINGQGLILVYPNPATDVLHVDMNSPSAATFEILDLLGRVIYVSPIHQGPHTISIENLGRGFYLAKVKTNTGEQIVKWMKE